jgi:hypothetical protein
MAGVGVVAEVGRQISREMAGAPAGPGTAHSPTTNAPSRASSSSEGGGMKAAAFCRVAPIVSGRRPSGLVVSLMTRKAAASSASNGGGGPTVEVLEETGSAFVIIDS